MTSDQLVIEVVVEPRVARDALLQGQRRWLLALVLPHQQRARDARRSDRQRRADAHAEERPSAELLLQRSRADRDRQLFQPERSRLARRSDEEGLLLLLAQRIGRIEDEIHQPTLAPIPLENLLEVARGEIYRVRMGCVCGADAQKHLGRVDSLHRRGIKRTEHV